MTAISVVSKNKAGIASGSFVTFQEIGGTLGLATIVSFVQIYPNFLEGFNKGALGLLVVSLLGSLSGIMLFKKV